MAEKLRNQSSILKGRAVIGGLIASGVIGAGIYVNGFDSSGGISPEKRLAWEPLYINCTGTGGDTTYDVCVAQNPLTNIEGEDGSDDAGSGAIRYVRVEVEDNPAGAGFDVCIMKALNTASGATQGPCLIDTGASGTGSWKEYTTTQGWGSGEYIVVKSLKDPTTSLKMRVYVEYGDIFGQ